MEHGLLFLSPVLRLELQFLTEVGKLVVAPDEILGGLAADHGARLSEDPFPEVIARAMGLGWTRDPFDRLLVATAHVHGAPFVTRDRRIHTHYDRAVW